MKDKKKIKHLIAVLLTCAMVVTGPGFSLSALGAQYNQGANAQDKIKTERSVSDAGTDNASGSKHNGTDSSAGEKEGGNKKNEGDRNDNSSGDSGVKEENTIKDIAGKNSDENSGENATEKNKDEENGKETKEELVQRTISSVSGDYSITVSGSMPRGADLSVNEIESSNSRYRQYEKAAADKISDSDKELEADSLAYARFFDIKIKDKEGKEFQPKDDLSVKIDTKDGALKTKEVKFKAVHFKDSDNIKKTDTELVPVKVNKGEEGSTADFKADSFSVYGVAYYYTVDFYYNDAEYHMNGGSTMKMSALFKELKIDRKTEDISKVEFTDDSLVKFTKESSDYNIESLKPFSTSETLTISFKDGTEIVIGVEDAVSGTMDTNVKWEINNNGVLTIEPGTGSLSSRIANKYAQKKESSQATTWPWKGYANSITEIIITGDIGTYPDTDLNFMFANCTNLEKADLSGLTSTSKNDSGDTNTNTIRSLRGMFLGCENLTTVTGFDRFGTLKPTSTIQNMFDGCEALKSVDLSKIGTDNVENMSRLFNGCSSLESLDLSAWKNNGKVNNMQNMCNGCSSLTSFTLNNQGFVTRNKCQFNDHYESKGVFIGCDSLKTVDMSNITLKANHENNSGLWRLFYDLPALETVYMENTNLSNVSNMSQMFQNSKALKKVVVNPTAKLDDITNMDDFVRGCTALEILDISGMDNSVLDINANKNFDGRQLGIDTLDSLKELIADNSKVWMMKNSANGTTVPYENISNDHNVEFFTTGTFEFTPKGKISEDKEYTGNTVTTNARGVLDLIAHSTIGTEENNPYLKLGSPHPVGFLAPGTYKRTSKTSEDFKEIPMTFWLIDGMKDVDPIVETKINGHWESVQYKGGPWQEEYGDYIVEFDTYGKIGFYTKPQKASVWRKGTVDNTYNYSDQPIRIRYENAATDVNGNKKDVLITISKISFNNMNRIPNLVDEQYMGEPNPWGPGTKRTDLSKIPGYEYHWSGPYGTDGVYDRYLLNAARGELRFWNQITAADHNPDPEDYYDGTWQYGKGSGTDIDFKLEVEGAAEGQSVLYWCDDLDLPNNEIWKMDETDPLKDQLQQTQYGAGSEGVILGEGNMLDTVTFADHTGLERRDSATDAVSENGDYIVGRGTDPMTSWSRFYVKAAANGTEYKWTTGVSCETSILKNTSFKRPTVMNVVLEPAAEKLLNERRPSGKTSKMFKFDMVGADDVPTVEVEGKTYDNLALDGDKAVLPTKDMPVHNDGSSIDFGTMTFENPGTDGVHAYVYKISEEINPDHTTAEDLITKWDETEYYVRVIVRSPGTDLEWEKGTRAIVTMGKKTSGSSDIVWDSQSQTIFGEDTKTTPKIIGDGSGNTTKVSFKNEAKTVTLPEGSLDFTKAIDGRTWKDTDKFHIALMTTTEQHDNPMPDGYKTTSGIRHSDFIITKESGTLVQGSDDHSYSKTFGGITFTGEDMLDDNGKLLNEKTFKYVIREFNPQESEDIQRIPGITYCDDEYMAEVKITRNTGTGDLTIESCKIYKMENGEKTGDPLDEAEFINKYDAQETTYHMSGEKNLTSMVPGHQLQSGDYTFVLKPIGQYAAICPMPKDATGTGAERILEVQNSEERIDFRDLNAQNDGLTFNYTAIRTALLPYFDNDYEKVDDALHGDGVHFEYEIYEKIPNGTVNNDDGTYSLYDSENDVTTVYDGIHHTRKIVVKTIADPDDPSKEMLTIEGHADDHKKEFYIDAHGFEQDVTHLPDFDTDYHHTKPDGAPVFQNKYVPDTGSVEVDKIWNDDGDKSKRTELTFTLYRKAGGNDPVEVKEDAFGNNVHPKKLETKEDGSVKWDNLPLTSSGSNVEYFVKETGADKEYIVTAFPDTVTLEKDKTSKITIRNTLLKDKDKTVKSTIHYVDNKGKTLFKDDVQELTFKAHPVARYDEQTGKYIVDDEGNLIVDWYDEGENIIGTDSGDGSGIDWGKSLFEKKFKDVKSPEKEHYTYDKENVPGESITGASEDLEVTVVYTPDNYKVHFDANTGTGTMPDQEMEWDQKENLDKNTFKKEGYRFVGWNTKADGSGTSYKDQQSVVNFVDEQGNEITLYAQWEKEIYKVIFENGKHGKSNGGTEDKEYGSKPQDNTVKASKGYKFTGKYTYVITDKDGNVIERGTTDDPSSIIVIGNIVFTPLYEKAAANKKEKNKNKEKKNKEKNNKEKTEKKNKGKHVIRKGKAGTGDGSNAAVYMLIFLSSGALLAIMAVSRRRRNL